MIVRSTSKKRNSSVINAGSMADIAFLLLIFFLVTTEIVEQKGLFVVLPAYDKNPLIIEQPDDRTLSVLVNFENKLLVEDDLLDINVLKERVYEHLVEDEWQDVGPIVSFRADRSTDYDTYLTAYNEILAAYRQLRDERATARYGLAFDELDRSQKQVIAEEVPMYLSEAEMTDMKTN